jgi:hypothetical protein
LTIFPKKQGVNTQSQVDIFPSQTWDARLWHNAFCCLTFAQEAPDPISIGAGSDPIRPAPA